MVYDAGAAVRLQPNHRSGGGAGTAGGIAQLSCAAGGYRQSRQRLDRHKPSRTPYTVQFGSAEANPTGNPYSRVDVTFPTPFAGAPKVFTSPGNFPKSGNAPLSCYPSNITMTGFTANLACSVPTGGGGDTIDQQITVDWLAIR